jgi:hypothetical protein
MRLTLRTLLAYLDNTLDPQDAEALRQKVAESGFANQLVQRIRGNLASQQLTAPSPDAVGPVDDPNVISEYLDSTLSSEQVAEIERACLESDPRLAEAAACHQILTMVLGTSANVPPVLRQRIYELRDRVMESDAAGVDDASSTQAQPAQPTPALASTPARAWADEVPTADATYHSQRAIEPVGVADSGVSDAPTRLRQSAGGGSVAASAAVSARQEPAIAGSKPRAITDSDFYGGSIRPSRITAWLVALAVTGVLLFALSQIFAPLLEQGESLTEANPADQTDGVSSELPAAVSGVVDDSVPADRQIAAVGPDTEPVPLTAEPVASSPTPPALPPSAASSPIPSQASTTQATTSQASKALEPAPTVPGAESAAETVPSGDDPSPLAVAAPMTESARPVTEPPPASELSADLETVAMPDAGEAVQVGKITSGNTLIAARSKQDWALLGKGAPVETGVTIVCGPSFNAELETDDGMLIKMFGPNQVSWQAEQDGAAILHLETGKLLISSQQPQSKLALVLAGQQVRLTFADASHVAAIEVRHRRAPGLDPLIAENHVHTRIIRAVQGTIQIDTNDAQTIETGQQWLSADDSAAVISADDPLPVWIAPPAELELSLEATARQGLLELLAENEQGLEIGLREATGFRRAEVAALAGQTLLSLGRGDVYFDAVGILNQPNQRAYWRDHFLALQQAVDQSVETAAGLHDSIRRMDAINGAAIIRLLTGFSQQQLRDGGDLELVEMLDSPSMAVRVLAIENLRAIMDTTLYFRAEQENAVRREAGIKKWLARQRKGDIRWPE